MTIGPSEGKVPEIDLSLLNGFSYTCLPDCGLCCYATPAVSPGEKPPLFKVDPKTPFVEGEGGYVQIAGRPDGGACHFLQANRCRCHSVRPFPCAEFPVSVHIGSRAQATLILSCPGVDIGRIASWASLSEPKQLPLGLDPELALVKSEYGRHPVTKWMVECSKRESTLQQRMRKKGMWIPPEELRTLFLEEIPMPGEGDFPVSDPPGKEEGIDALPLFFDERLGRVALRSGSGGWEALTIMELGGMKESIGCYQPLDQPPSMDKQAEAMLHGYLSYITRRDMLLWAIYLELQNHPEVSLIEMFDAFLREVGGQVLTRGCIRAQMDGNPSATLSRSDIEKGIRATDADLMDQLTLGRVL